MPDVPDVPDVPTSVPRVGVVVLTQGDRGGGAEFVARTWAARLAERGHEVSFVVTSPPDTDTEP